MRTFRYLGVLLTIILPVLAYAQDSVAKPVTYKLMAPLAGYLTDEVNLTQYLQGAVQVTIGIGGILAVLMIVICGIQLMGTPSASQKSESKECIWNAIVGLLLAIGAWVILNTINSSLVSTGASLTGVQLSTPTTPTTQTEGGPLSIDAGTLSPTATVGTNYVSEIDLTNTMIDGGVSGAIYQWSISNGALPPGLALHNQFVCIPLPCREVASIYGTPTTPGTYTFTVSVTYGTVTTSQTFTTTVADAPPIDVASNPSSLNGWTVGTGQALYIHDGEAMLTGEWYAPNTPPVDSYFFVEWGTTSSLGKKTPRVKLQTQGELTWGGDWLTGLTPGTTYYYRIAVAPTLTGTPAHGQAWSFVAGDPGSWPITTSESGAAAYVLPKNCVVKDKAVLWPSWVAGGGYNTAHAPVIYQPSAETWALKFLASDLLKSPILTGKIQEFAAGTDMTISITTNPCVYVASNSLTAACQSTGDIRYYSSSGPLSSATAADAGYCKLPALPAGQTYYYLNVRYANTATGIVNPSRSTCDAGRVNCPYTLLYTSPP